MLRLHTKCTLPMESASTATIRSFAEPPFTICMASVSTTSLASASGNSITANVLIIIRRTIVMLFLIFAVSISYPPATLLYQL